MKKLILFLVAAVICGGIVIVAMNLPTKLSIELLSLGIALLTGGGLYLLFEEKNKNESIMDFIMLLVMIFLWMLLTLLTTNIILSSVVVIVLVLLYLLCKHFLFNSKRATKGT